jgi:hypothetical protein
MVVLTMDTLFPVTDEGHIFIGNGYSLKKTSEEKRVHLYRNGKFVSENILSPAIEKRLFVVDLIDKKGVMKSKIATALTISRQSIDNWLIINKKYGSEGLVNNTKNSWKKNPKRFRGNKARQLEEKHTSDAKFLYNEEYDYQPNRYAGNLLYLSELTNSYDYLKQLSVKINKHVWIPLLFVMMHVNKISSIEQLKTIFKGEFGKILGIKRLTNLSNVREEIHELVQKKSSLNVAKQFFKLQVIKAGVSIWRIFLDGHFVPYSGKEKVHKAHSTQRDLMMPGQTEFFGHDSTGKIVYFDIEEGQGDMVKNLKKYSKIFAKYNDNTSPLFVCDRELWGVDNFLFMSDCRFVTWEKNCDKKETTETIAESMLKRWGCSENGFKHLGTRTNMHYNPAWNISEESQKQQVINPEYIDLKQTNSETFKVIDKGLKFILR